MEINYQNLPDCVGRIDFICVIVIHYCLKETIEMINIIPSAAIRKNYNEISELCKRSKEPVYLTKNGIGDLVVMDLETYARRESMLKLRETLLRSEADIQQGRLHSIDETAAAMRLVIAEVSDGKRG